MKVKEESENVGLKQQKTKTLVSGSITTWQIDGETVETMTAYFEGGAPKSLQMVTTAMKNGPWKKSYDQSRTAY